MATLSGQLAGIGAPLDDGQGKQLTDTIVVESRRIRAILGSGTPPT